MLAELLKNTIARVGLLPNHAARVACHFLSAAGRVHGTPQELQDRGVATVQLGLDVAGALVSWEHLEETPIDGKNMWKQCNKYVSERCCRFSLSIHCCISATSIMLV